MSSELRFRQVHLDFHTSEHIPGIGSEFDPNEFVATLKSACVDSITCFSRCHHGWIYHDTKFPYQHPHLKTNLLVEQVRACHKADIKVPVYVTVGWDQLMGRLHPEWLEVDLNGKLGTKAPLQDTWGWYKHDFASPYLDYVIAQTEEVCDLLGDELDGLFFDIMFQSGVHSQHCLDRYKALGWDPRDEAKQQELRHLLVAEATERIASAVRAKNKTCTLFFNSGHVDPYFRQRLAHFSHMEVESLPTGGWGYMHFPITARYTRTLGVDFLGMTGKFSESWGHFGSYKAPAALEFECLSALAFGGKCSVGDQLPPTGKIDASTYELIGHAYRKVKELEPWCRGAKGVAEIAILNAEIFNATEHRIDPRNLGATRMLMERQHQFDIVDLEADWNAYAVLVLPDGLRLASDEKIQAYLDQGGKVIAAQDSLLNEAGEPWPCFASCVAGCEGPRPFSPEYIRYQGVNQVAYERGISLIAAPGAEVWATITEPYFNRTWETFCSHSHTPAAQETDRPAMIVAGNVVAFAHPIFTTYAVHGILRLRELFLLALDHLLPVPLVECPGPSSLQAHLTRQGDRHLLHLLHYISERRGLMHDLIEDPLLIPGTQIRVRGSATTATLVPSGEALPARREGEVLVIDFPGALGHQVICLE